MKKLSFSTLLQLLLVVCALNLSSCQEFNIDTQANYSPQLDTDAQPEYTVLAKSSQSITFTISSRTPWTIESNKTWCRTNPAMSSASSLIAEITVLIDENATEQDRDATLTIKAEGLDVTKVITIKQDAKGKLGVQPVDGSLSADGGTASFTVLSNKAWTVTSSHQWLTFDKNGGAGIDEVETITVMAEANTGLRRTATVTVSNGLEEKRFDVMQEGILLIFVETDDVIFDGNTDKESKTFEVTSNIEWNVSSDAKWLSVQKTPEGKVEVTTLSEIYFTTRTAHIMLVAADPTIGIEPVSLEVKQASGAYLLDVVAPATSSVDETTGALTLTELAGNGKSRYYVDKFRNLSVHEWTFSSIQVDDNRCINMNCIPYWNLWLGMGANNWKFKYKGGGVNVDSPITPFEMNQLRALKLVHDYLPADKSQTNVQVFIKLEGETEWTRIVETASYPNPYGSVPSTNKPYLGLADGPNGKRGTITISSYEVTNLE